MSRIYEYSRIFTILLIVGLATIGCEVERPKPELNVNNLNMAIEFQIAMEKAIEVYNQAVADGIDLSNGPCLANHLHGNADYSLTVWVLDIAHYPREDIDDLPENQCSAYRDGQARNYIEFDPDGNLIKYYAPLLEQQQKQQ